MANATLNDAECKATNALSEILSLANGAQVECNTQADNEILRLGFELISLVAFEVGMQQPDNALVSLLRAGTPAIELGKATPEKLAALKDRLRKALAALSPDPKAIVRKVVKLAARRPDKPLIFKIGIVQPDDSVIESPTEYQSIEPLSDANAIQFVRYELRNALLPGTTDEKISGVCQEFRDEPRSGRPGRQTATSVERGVPRKKGMDPAKRRAVALLSLIEKGTKGDVERRLRRAERNDREKTEALRAKPTKKPQ